MSKYQGRVDPIDILRTYMSKEKKIKCKDGYLHFDNVRLKLTTETAWLSPITNQKYDLGSLWLLMDCQVNNIGVSDYIERTSKYNVTMINSADKPQILGYFKGEIAESNCVNNDLKIEIIQKQMKKDKEEEELMAQKKPKIETETDLNVQVVMWLKSFERPITSKNRSLRTMEKSYEEVIKSLMNGGVQYRQTAKINSSKTRLATIYEKKKNPIIIVPDSYLPGNVDIKNIRSLLSDGSYIDSSQLEDTMVRKIQLTHTIKQKNVIFDITNNASLLTIADWSCVIAIFISGRYVQFRGWEQTNPTNIFQKHRGFLLKYPDSKAGEANDWNVKIINIQKSTRYQDIDVHRFIWGEIERELLAPSP